MIRFILNDDDIQTDLPAGGTLLDFVRYQRRLTGTKCGCREGDCGACTVLVGDLLPAAAAMRYRAMTSCLTPLANVHGKHVVTVEGINPPEGALTPVQQALVDENGTQCGFCTAGFVMSLTGFCLKNKTGKVSLEEAVSAVDGNICRCTGYKSIERAAARMTRLIDEKTARPALQRAVEQGVAPAYFLTIKDRLAALQALPPADSASRLLVAGGTDLYVQRPEELANTPARHLFDFLSFKGIRFAGDDIEIGGAATVTDLLESPLLQDLFPHLDKHLKLVSSTPIRNMATVAGNLVNASPIGDLTVWLLALDARVVLRDGAEREIPLREFYRGYKTLAKTAGEVLETIRFRRPAGIFYVNFEKVSKRTFLDIASVNSAIFLKMHNGLVAEARLSMGGVAPVPLFLEKTAAFLTGKNPSSADFLDEANAILQTEISPISDVRGSAAYKRLLARQLLRAHFLEIFSDRLGGENG